MRIKIILVLAYLFGTLSYAQCDTDFQSMFVDGVYLNPGIKIGYVFGKNGGIIMGFELSCGYLGGVDNLPYFFGGVLGFDVFSRGIKLHLNVEGQYWPAPGVAVEPVLFIEKKEPKFGANLLIYDGIGYAHIYANINFVGTSHQFTEFGLFGKAPIKVGSKN